MRESEREPAKVAGLGYAAWVVIYLGAMALAMVVYRLGWVGGEHGYLVMFAPLLLVPAMARAQMGSLARRGVSSPSLSRYSRRIMTMVLLIVVTVVGTVRFGSAFSHSPGMSLLFALIVAAPPLGCVWVMARYFTEEEDEFLRHKAMGGALFSLGFVLVCGAIYGSLQTFGLAPLSNALWVVVAWAFGMGFGNLWQWMRGK